MSTSRRELLQLAAMAGATATFPGLLRAAPPEKTDVSIATGGKALIYYLPQLIAEVQGYFKDEGLNATVIDFAGGSKAVQAVVGGSADIASGGFDHVAMLQSKGQKYRTFVQQGRAPMAALGVSTKTMPNYQSPVDLKGKKIGVTAPGSSTNMMASFFLAKHGLTPNDVSYIGVGGGAGAVTAIRSGQIDAIANQEPVLSTLVYAKELKIIADTRTLAGTREVFGGNMPSCCLFASQAFIDQNPNTIQALTNALVRADRWLKKASLDEIVKVVPKSYQLGDSDLYKLAVQGNREGMSPDGLMAEDGPAMMLKALASYVPGFKADTIDVSALWTNYFAGRANEKYAND